MTNILSGWVCLPVLVEGAAPLAGAGRHAGPRLPGPALADAQSTVWTAVRPTRHQSAQPELVQSQLQGVAGPALQGEQAEEGQCVPPRPRDCQGVPAARPRTVSLVAGCEGDSISQCTAVQHKQAKAFKLFMYIYLSM